MLADPTPTPSARSSARSRTSANEAVLHTDASVMPRRRRAWASWNYHLGAQPGPATVTYWMNRLQALRRRHGLLRHAQPHGRDRPGEGHPHDRLRAPRLHARGPAPRSAATREVSGVNRTHYCGAYWGWGFHEDGVQSGLRVGRGDPDRRTSRCRHERRALHGHRAPPPLPDARQRVHARVAYAYLDLDDAAAARRRRRSSLPRASDYLTAGPLARRAQAGTDRRRCACSPRRASLGLIFNPVSFYYCFDGDDRSRPCSPR